MGIAAGTGSLELLTADDGAGLCLLVTAVPGKPENRQPACRKQEAYAALPGPLQVNGGEAICL